MKVFNITLTLRGESSDEALITVGLPGGFPPTTKVRNKNETCKSCTLKDV